LLEDPAEACEVVQEVFVKVFRNIGNFRAQSTLKTWIYRIALNEAHNHRRWFGRHRGREVGLDTEDTEAGRSYGESLAEPGRSPYDVVLEAETHELVEEALARVKPVYREAVVLRDIEGFSYEEVAEVLQVSLGTVKSRILRGREALRVALSEKLAGESVLGWEPQMAD
jgi:RNA polymerase sigma-70 factor (ECF subfamily)